jgi:serine/threonine protein kinase
VALKVILAGAHAGTEQRDRFRREAEAAARLSHPNIVQVYEVGEHDGRPYCALEYVEGGSLARRLAAGALPPDGAARLVEVLARAVQHAHERNIVHRDLKPANILLADEGVPKVTDFGLARLLDEDSGHTLTGDILGTPCYMAPEQAAGRTREAGPAADVYALGAVLYETLTGRPPFQGATLRETLDQVLSQDATPPSVYRPDLPGDLEAVCLKCLEKEQDRRYPSARALAEDLCRFLAGEAVSAVKISDRDWHARCARRAGYELLEELGRGGMGVAYKARQLSLNRVVVLKVILGLRPHVQGESAGTPAKARTESPALPVADDPRPTPVEYMNLKDLSPNHIATLYERLMLRWGAALASRLVKKAMAEAEQA